VNIKIARDILIIATIKSIPDLKRQPLLSLILGLVGALPLFFMTIFGAQISHGLIGAMVGSVSFSGLLAPIQDIAGDRYLKIREMLVAMPVHPFSYAIGLSLASLIISSPALLVFVVLALWLGALTPSSLLWSVIILILCWGTLSSLGFIISTYLQKASLSTVNNLATLLGFALTFLPPVYYPEEILGNLSWMALLFPTSNAVGLIRIYSGLLGASVTMISVRWLILLATMTVCGAATLTKARWRET